MGASSMKTIFGGKIKQFRRDVTGAVFIQVALAMMGVSGMAGLAIDVGNWYATQRAMQTAADAAAAAAAYEALWGGDTETIAAAAKAAAERNGYDAASVTVDPGYGTPDAVEVTVRESAPGMFSALVMGKGSLDIAVRSVAGRVNGEPVCILALKPVGRWGIHLRDNSKLTATGCMVQSNSTDPHSIDVDGDAHLTAAATATVGGVLGELNFSPSADTDAGAIADPLAYLTPPAAALGSCDEHPTKEVIPAGTATLSEGVYCGGIEVLSGADVTFNPGIYVIRDGALKTSGASSIHGEGVGFYLTGSGAVVNVGGSGTVDFSAPVAGDMDGILFYQGPDAPAGVISQFSGHELRFEGALYFPDQRLDLEGGTTSTSPRAHTTIVAESLHLHGNASLIVDSDYGASAVPVSKAFGRYRVAILE